MPSPTEVFIGFDSAWTDNPKARGAICALALRDDDASFEAPRLASFAEALAFIDAHRSTSGVTLIAIDQPTIVPNLTSLRPVERVAASLISWLGGGVQPANRGRVGMFCDASPIWSFLRALDVTHDPLKARSASDGLHVIEVFPALALPTLNQDFFGRNAAPKYNPARRRKFRMQDWRSVALSAARWFEGEGFGDASKWCRDAACIERLCKADQDRLDAMLCLLIALWWRRGAPESSVMLGCTESGYIVTPASHDVRARLVNAAEKMNVVVR